MKPRLYRQGWAVSRSRINYAILDHQKQRSTGSGTTGAPGAIGDPKRGLPSRQEASQRSRSGEAARDSLEYRQRRVSRSCSKGWLELRKGSGLYVRPLQASPDGEEGLDRLLSGLLNRHAAWDMSRRRFSPRLEHLVRPRLYQQILIVEPDAAMRADP